MYDFRMPPNPSITWGENARRVLDCCAALDGLGVDGVWLTEHHFTEDGYLPALMPMAAAVAMRTQRCSIGTSVLLAPLHQPVALAEAAAVVDNLSGGRLALGLGLCYRAEELAAFGVDKRHRGARLDETIEILRQSWTPGPVEFAGTHFTLSGIDVTPKPWQSPLPLWLAARGEVAVRRAGRVADGVILAGDPGLPATIRATVAEQGRDPAAVTVACLRSLAVRECLSAAELDEVSAGLRWRSERYQRWYSTAADLPQDRTFVSAGTATGGDAVRSLADELDALAELRAQGYDYVIYHGTAPGVDPSLYLRQWTALLEQAA